MPSTVLFIQKWFKSNRHFNQELELNFSDNELSKVVCIPPGDCYPDQEQEINIKLVRWAKRNKLPKEFWEHIAINITDEKTRNNLLKD